MCKQAIMAEKRQKFLQDLLMKPGNNTCADCGVRDPEWASYNIGVFLCQDCCGVHRSMGAHISKIKSIRLDNWDDDQLRIMESLGNLKATQKYEQQVPPCYKIPTFRDAPVLKDQWIRAKYERLEFSDPDKQTYLSSYREGFLNKQGKDDKKFHKRRFVLSETDGTLKYYNKEDAKADPKAVLRIDDINVTLVPEKVGNPNAMQLMYEMKDKHTRSIYLTSDESRDLIDWYTAIRSAKLNRLRIAYPGAEDSELVNLLTRDFLKEGWLSKTGPKPGDAYRRRWVSLDKRKLMYFEDRLDAFPKGEIYLGTKEKGFAVREGVPPGMKDPGNSFTLKTPDRHFHFSAESGDEQKEWVAVLKTVLQMPLSPQDSSNLALGHRKRSSLHSVFGR